MTTTDRDATVKDTPHTMLGDMQREHARGLDLDGCNFYSIVMPLNEYEVEAVRAGKHGHRLESWPDGIRVRMAKEIELFNERNGASTIRGVTTGINQACCVLGIHWKPKS